MTDLVKLALIGATPPTLTALGALIIGLINKGRITKNAKNVEEIKATGKETHKLVDGTLAIQYQVNATSARTLSNLTKLPEHVTLADAAEFQLKEHLAKLAELGLREGAENGS